MKKLYGSIVKWLIHEGAISSQEEELYVFAIESLALLIAPLLLSIVIGAFYQSVIYRILLILPFMLIRKYSGGYHAQSQFTCLLISSLLIIAAYEVAGNESLKDVVEIVYIFASILLCVLSPVDSENRRLTGDEKKMYGHKCRCWVVSFGVISLILKNTAEINFSLYFEMGVIISAILQLPCCIKRMVAHAGLNMTLQE